MKILYQKYTAPSLCLCITFLIFFGSYLLDIHPLRAQPDTKPRDLAGFLKKYIAFSQNELQRALKGKVVTKLLKSDVRYEIPIFGILRIDVPRQKFIEFFPNRELVIESALAIEMGKFGTPARMEDVRNLTLDKDDLKALEKCKIGHCDIKLNAEAISLFRTMRPWERPDFEENATQAFRRMMVAYVNAYRKGGNSALAVYHDKKQPLYLVNEFKDLLRESPYLYEYRPRLHQYLEAYPKIKLPNSREYIFWAKDDLGTKRKVISLTHLVIYQPVEQKIADFLIASKQLYASHYFEAALGITALADNPSGDMNSFFLIYLIRSRIDVLRHKFFGLIKKKVQGAVKKQLALKMLRVKSKAESLYRDQMNRNP